MGIPRRAQHGCEPLGPCANPDCSKFLIDHSRPNSARWCSMAECGNRMKARRHYARQTG
ncbi:CGNR zinc finger domain-containing protein [Leifsonia sp. RAF41]|uniref:CGNR zinc finger domain-containing protein n=1 Tax=Leifsonia sp. RAF41 TaxID=3233056 RepID=UPI003F9AB22E